MEEIKADLFTSNTSLVHCVSSDFVMGKGIAVEFKKRFGRIDDLKAQNKQIGDVAVLDYPDKFIYYMITTEKYWNKPTYENFILSLIGVKTHCLANNVTKLSMPRIGCGLDKLEWNIIKNFILGIFKDTNIQIKVYCL